MKVTESDTRREIVSVFDVEGGPVLPMEHSTIDRKYRVEKVKVTYKFSTEKNAWIVQSGFHVELSGTVLKRDGSDSKNYHQVHVPYGALREPLKYPHLDWLFDIVDMAQPVGVPNQMKVRGVEIPNP